MNLPSSNRGKNCPESSRSIVWNSVPREVGCTMVRASTIKLLTVQRNSRHVLYQIHSERTVVIFLRNSKKEKQRKDASAVFWYATLDHRVWTDGIGFQVLDDGPTRFNKHLACRRWKLLSALERNVRRAQIMLQKILR